ncbi:fused MFS/spermidine synthase [Candidatus Uhrbacteria bacterium]|nr:fused MFS/spermidine synthase [Candidatus Uhrbacteria bacterium]
MFIYSLIAFFSGLAVMGIELTASRLIAPYFGTSLFVWTNVIAVILAALSLGYYLGGRLSERLPDLALLLRLILFAGIIVAIIPWFIRPVASLVSFDAAAFGSTSLVIALGSFLLTVLLFFIPLMLLGMTTPFLVKLASLKRSGVGDITGRLFAVSTVGSLVGTFLPALIFIPWFGSRASLLIFAGLLMIMGLAGFKKRGVLMLLPLLVLPLGMINGQIKTDQGLLAEAETPYQYVRVYEKDGRRYLVYNEGGGVQSVWRPETVWSGWKYYDTAALLPALREGQRVLIVGLAGGTISRAMQALYGDDSDFKMDGLEIDPEVIELASRYFDLEQPNLSVINVDGRVFLEREKGNYEVIFVDAYANQLYIPFQLSTQEFFTAAKHRLSEAGILAMNINAANERSPLLATMENTVAAVFPFVYRLRMDQSWNYLLVASQTPIDFEVLRTRRLPIPEFEDLAQKIPDEVRIVSFDARERIFTDNWAPVEHLTDAMLWDYAVGQRDSR